MRSVTCSNLRCILDQTKVFVNPSVTTKHSLNGYRAYEVPPGEEWKIGLLSSLIQIREGEWTVSFDEESHESNFEDEAFNSMIDTLCIS